MDRSTVISLIELTRTQDEYGVWRESETSTDVFAQVLSVTQKEFYEGGRNGLNPELKFEVFYADYSDQPIIEYNDNRYSVYRTYLKKNDILELYVERKGGTNTTVSA